MIRYSLLALVSVLSLSAFAQDASVEGFNSRFTLERNAEGKDALNNFLSPIFALFLKCLSVKNKKIPIKILFFKDAQSSLLYIFFTTQFCNPITCICSITGKFYCG